mmetsp:Transcript_4151/g.9710  ORF Transcript_4151/g.9710 Transcript_4151/m.9710 type:complete len:311 (-) Transcript_4151:151-1083(-)|eukprot:CAMPEP_0170602156 /NCGR_PEP_ID=MMETSP0224-20130122/18242_1 /TAXON_ID=285029 /ORGANISM="Togula jolla, Strain CCCM 725" /LENGTH=310 /DNA_ID=CAMNT_0010926979 /DNA_START=58 /DNA_END=990 /DNA_ORIENTATION=+
MALPRTSAANRSGDSVEVRRVGRLLLALGIGAAFSQTFAFVGGRGLALNRAAEASPRLRASTAARRAGFDFGIKEAEEHTGLVVEDKDEGKSVSTHGSLMTGQWNTVLGDTELPKSGRSYWEVKIVNKPTDAWEYIGVAEPDADVSLPLPRSKKGGGWSWGGTLTESMVYMQVPWPKDFAKTNNAAAAARMREYSAKNQYGEKQIEAELTLREKALGSTDKANVGLDPDRFPPFRSGMVIGVDVDMDQGSLSFWANGDFLGPVRDATGKPLDLKGKKIVPAVSVYGRTTGAVNQFTEMEVRTGLTPPALP